MGRRMKRLALGFCVLGAFGLAGCDYLPDPVKALISRPQTAVTGSFKNGSFKGVLKVVFLEPKNAVDRTVKLIEPFGYKDSKGVDWDVPADFESDGASIPWSLWSFIGGPFDGPYRDAAIIHDYYCNKKDRKWEEVHAMFLEASLRRGVPESTAQTMYAGILYGGPRWPAPSVLQKAQVTPAPATPPKTEQGITKRQATDTEKLKAEELKRWIETTKPTPQEIMKKVEEMRAAEGKSSK